MNKALVVVGVIVGLAGGLFGLLKLFAFVWKRLSSENQKMLQDSVVKSAIIWIPTLVGEIFTPLIPLIRDIGRLAAKSLSLPPPDMA
jgi:hypothetical protein